MKDRKRTGGSRTDELTLVYVGQTEIGENEMCKSKDRQEKFAMRKQDLAGQPECADSVHRYGNAKRHIRLSDSASAGIGLSSDMRSANTSRPNRANDLARAIATWNDARTDRSFAVAVWGIGVDVVFGKSVFVPTSLAGNGALKAMGPIDGNGNRFYVCHIDLPDKTGENGTAHTEVSLADLLKTVLSDAQAVGLAIHLGDIRLLVGRPELEDLSAKVGMAFDKEDGNAEEEM